MKKIFKVILVLGVLYTVGCANSKKPNNPSQPAVYEPTEVGPGLNPGDSDGLGNWEYGGGANVTIPDLVTFDEYTGVPMTEENREDVYLNINLQEKDGELFAGTVTVEYKWDGHHYVDYFRSGDKEEEYKNNKWVEIDGKTVWHGIFEDMRYGAIIVVFDEFVDSGDGDGGPKSHASGRVYFKNFKSTAYHPPQLCWTFSKGPYSCQTWKKTVTGQFGVPITVVDTTQAVDPYEEDDYKLLGSFKNIEITKAFNK